METLWERTRGPSVKPGDASAPILILSRKPWTCIKSWSRWVKIKIGADASPGFTEGPRVRSHNVSMLAFNTAASQHRLQQCIHELAIKDGPVKNGLRIRHSPQLCQNSVQLIGQNCCRLLTRGHRKRNGHHVWFAV